MTETSLSNMDFIVLNNYPCYKQLLVMPDSIYTQSASQYLPDTELYPTASQNS